MNSKSLIYFGIGLICIIIALVIFYTKFFNFMAFLFLLLTGAGVFLFTRGITEMKKKME